MAAAKLIRARVLIDHEPLGLKNGDIVEAASATVKGLAQAGLVDADKGAVEYAAQQGARVVTLASEAADDGADAAAAKAAADAQAQAQADADAAAAAQAQADADALAAAEKATVEATAGNKSAA